MGPSLKKMKFHHSLRFKIIIGLTALLTLTLTTFFATQYFDHRSKMIRNLQENISPHLTQMVSDVLKSAMISKNLSEMKYILEVANNYPDVKNIFIMNRIGKVILSNDENETGRTIDLQDATCQICHYQTTEALNKTVIYTTPRGEKIFRNVNPIYNRKECYPCHHPSEKITGVLVTDFTLENIDKQLRAEVKGNLLFLLLTILISTLVIGITLNQLVIKKLQYFVEATSLFGRGDFTGSIDFKSDDEIKRLAESFNVMAKALMEKRELERQYLFRIIEAEENERRRISRELHDEIGQALTAIRFNLDRIDQDLPETSVMARERVEEAKTLSQQTIKAMRRLSMDLRPSMLDELGLIPTLRWYIQNFASRLNIDSQFKAAGFDIKLPPPVETAFYRIVQEALNNAGKHAEASRVEVLMEHKDSTIYASIKDNGKGFDLDKVLHPESLERGSGIIGMQERVSILKGHIDIRSKPGSGTHIRIEIPCPKGSEDDEKDKGLIG